jgi:hypothetical protein
MINHVWSVFCSRSSTDRETNNISLFGVIEQISVLAPDPLPPGVGGVPMESELVSLWSRENLDQPERAGGRARLLAPDGNVAFSQEFDINLMEHARMRTQLRLNGFPLQGFGLYSLLVEQRQADETWKQVALIPVQVVRLTQPVA